MWLLSGFAHSHIVFPLNSVDIALMVPEIYVFNQLESGPRPLFNLFYSKIVLLTAFFYTKLEFYNLICGLFIALYGSTIDGLLSAWHWPDFPICNTNEKSTVNLLSTVNLSQLGIHIEARGRSELIAFDSGIKLRHAREYISTQFY